MRHTAFDSASLLFVIALTIGGFVVAQPTEAGVKGPSASAGRTVSNVNALNVVVARPAQQPAPPPGGGNGPNDPPDKIPRGTSDSAAPGGAGGGAGGGGVIIESGKTYALEYGILLLLVGAALGAVCKSSHRV